MLKMNHSKLQSDEKIAQEDQNCAHSSHVYEKKLLNWIVMRDCSIGLSAPKEKNDYFLWQRVD